MSTTTTKSLARALADETLSKITDRLRLTEVHAADGGPLMSLTSAMAPGPVGWVRVYRAASVDKVVNIGLDVPTIGMDSHMIFVFTKPESATPHFTLDSVRVPNMHAFHLDLIPRVDLGVNLEYMNATLNPLTPVFTEAQKIEGLTPAQLSPRQRAIMTPWMLAHRATEEAFAKIGGPVDAYLQHWFSIHEKGIASELAKDLTGEALAQRDRRYREILFNPEVDPVWNNVQRLVGAETALRMRQILQAQGDVAA